MKMDLTNVFNPANYKGLAHQDAALDQLQSEFSAEQLGKIAEAWRGEESSDPILLKNMARYFEGTPAQTAAVDLVKSYTTTAALVKFTAKWRQAGFEEPAEVRTVKLATDFIKDWEKLRLDVYNDGVGVLTVGYGHTDPSLRLGQKITEAKAIQYLREDMAWAIRVVADEVKVALTVGQRAALISFAFNVGEEGFRTSTLLKNLNAGDYEGVPAQMKRWINKGTDTEEGLRNRRNAEIELWSTEHKGVVPAKFPEPVKARSDADINWKESDCMISQFFTVGEVTQLDPRRIPTDAGVIKNILAIAKELDKIRKKWGAPIGVTSWYRPAAVNAEVGGVSNSQHIMGGAVDVYDISGRAQEFETFLDREWGDRALGRGVASGRGFTHLDLRLGRLRWDY